MNSLNGIEKINKLDSLQLAWLAGLFQAEASFQYDNRIRSDSNDDPTEYQPPPPSPIIKIEMIEEDLMNHVGELLGKSVKLQKRRTSAKNNVYRISLESREDVRTFVKAIRPYIVGNKTLNRIDDILYNCSLYDKWVADGGKTKQAAKANKASQEAKRLKKNQIV
jgi:hypothetical protein